MEPELQHPAEDVQPAAPGIATESQNSGAPRLPDSHHRGFDSIIVGPHGLRVGWSILLFVSMYYLFRMVIGTICYSLGLFGNLDENSAPAVLVAELVLLIAILGAALVMSFIEGRSITSYNLAGPHRIRHFFSGTAAGFVALSLLVGSLAWGGWLTFGPKALVGMQAVNYGAQWCAAFLIVGAVEEGLFRCYVLYTVARGINFWWALTAEVVICTFQFMNGGGNGAWGVYAIAALGLIPCLLLHQKSDPRTGAFWQAAWVTSSAFGLYHTYNAGENWIGVFAAASIGFVFCVSVRLTGSIWWAIGCHAAWDWAETFFYGTADSGLQGQGHYLTANPAGNPLWSGGSDGPEGSLLILGVIPILLLAMLVIYGRGKLASPPPQESEQAAG